MIALALLLSAAQPADVPLRTGPAAAAPLPGAVVPDEVLAQLRGGFRLPSGTEISIAVQSQTSIDGLLLLRSVYRIDQGAPTLSLFAPTGDQRIETGPATDAAGAGNGGGMAVMFDRSTGLILVPTGGGAPGPAVNVTAGGNRGMAAGDGLVALPVAPGGQIDTAGGRLALVGNAGDMRAQLAGAGIDVSHYFGQSFGTLIANSASDRTIDTVTNISLDVGNMTAETIGSAMLRIEAIALDASRGLIR